MTIGPWTLIAVLVIALAGYLIYVRHDNGGISFRGLAGELRQEAREGVSRIRDYLHGYLKGEN
jgi:hypothetical protein